MDQNQSFFDALEALLPLIKNALPSEIRTNNPLIENNLREMLFRLVGEFCVHECSQDADYHQILIFIFQLPIIW